MSNLIKTLTRTMLQLLGLGIYRLGLASWIINRSAHTRAVLYHAVEHECTSFTRELGVNVPPETFALHLEYYARYYRVISMSEHLTALESEGTKSQSHPPANNSSKPALLITFDDGYASVKSQALPMLEAHGMSATVYLIGNAVRGRMVWVNRLNQAINDHPAKAREVLAAYPGYPGLIDRSRRDIIHYVQTNFEPTQIEQLMERLELTIANLTVNTERLFSSPADIREMQTRGIEFGFHSNEHYNLGRCTDRELDAALTPVGLEDLVNSKTFAYPFGYFAQATIGRLKRQGYKLLLTVGSNNERFSELHTDRTEMFEQDFAHMFARLEIEEPCIAAVRRVAQNCRSRLRDLKGVKVSRAA